jgi:hypothetical protein
MAGRTHSKQSSTPIFKEFSGAFGEEGYGKSSELANMLQSLLTSGGDYGAESGSEQNLLNSIMDQTAGRGAVRGLGAPTQGSLATSIAPTLVDMSQKRRQQDIGGLLELIGLAMPQVVGGNVSSGSSGGWNIL